MTRLVLFLVFILFISSPLCVQSINIGNTVSYDKPIDLHRSLAEANEVAARVTSELPTGTPTSAPSSQPTATPSSQPTSEPTNTCVWGSEGPFCDTCIDGYYNDPLVDGVCTKCTHSDHISWFSIVGIVFLAIVVVLYGAKCYLEITDVSLYVHDWYHSDTWFVKLKILRLQEFVRAKNKDDVRLLDASMRKANELMLKYDKKMEAILDSFWAKMKIYASFYQIVALFPIVVGKSQLFGNFQSLVSCMAIINLDFSLTFSLSCLWNYDFVDILLAITLFPLIVCGLLYIIDGFYLNLSTDTMTVRKRRSGQCLVAFFVWTFLTLPAATSAIFQMLTPCRPIHTQYTNSQYEKRYGISIPSYLHADSSISCDSERYSFGKTWAIVMLFAYLLVLPGVYIRLLYDNCHHMKTRHNTIYAQNEFKTGVAIDDTGAQVPNTYAIQERLILLKPLKFLFAAYEPQYFYWEIIETYRRIFFCGVIIICQHGKTLQLVGGCVLCLVNILLTDVIQPFESSAATISSKITTWQLFGLYFVLLIASDERFSVNKNYALDWSMIAILVSGLVLELVLVLRPPKVLSQKSKYITVHTEVQTSEEKRPIEEEFDEDYALSFPGDPQPPMMLSRSNSFASRSQNRLFSRENSSSRLNPSQYPSPLQRQSSHYNNRAESRNHWDVNPSTPSVKNSSPPANGQSSLYSFVQESKSDELSASASGSRFFLKGPALEKMFQQEIQNYETISIAPDQMTSAACNELEMPELSSAKPSTLERSRSGLITDGTNVKDEEGHVLSNGPIRDQARDHDDERVSHASLKSKIELAPIDDRQRKFNLLTTPLKASSSIASSTTIGSPTTPLNVGAIDSASVPTLNKGRSEDERLEEDRRRVAAEEAALEEEKQRILQERESLLRANEELKANISQTIGVDLSDDEDADEAMLKQLRKLNEENENLHRDLGTAVTNVAMHGGGSSASNIYDSSIHDEEEQEMIELEGNGGSRHGMRQDLSDEAAELLAMKEAMLQERARLLEDNELMKAGINSTLGGTNLNDDEAIDNVMLDELMKLHAE